MSKVKCRVCANEVSGFCKIKKSKVAVNKPRKCDSFVYDESKIRVREAIPTVRFSYVEKENHRKKLKKDLKELKRNIEIQKKNALRAGADLIKPQVPKQPVFSGDNKHPLTGDLSRFKTTAADEG